MHSPALLLATALAFSPGFAQPWARPPEPIEKRQTVSYGDLDLATPAGARAMLVRIRRAVIRTCAERRTPQIPHSEWHCRQAALTRALTELNAPLVTAAVGGKLKANQALELDAPHPLIPAKAGTQIQLRTQD